MGNRTEQKRKNRTKKLPIDNFPPVLSSKTLWTHFHCSWVSDLNSSVSPLRHSFSIRPAIRSCNFSSYPSVINVKCVVSSHLLIFYKWGSPKMVILSKFKHACTVWALCSASTCHVEYHLMLAVIREWHWLLDAVWHDNCCSKSP